MHVFLSYSRQEFYYVDSVAAILEAAGHTVWFDVQQLSPGLDWRQGIDEGLNDCEALVLVASRKSIDSENVAYEWQSALKQGKPVYILAYESVTLPSELKPTAIVTGRGTFERTMRRLRECLEDGKLHQDSISRPHWWNQQPPRIRIMAGVLAINSLWSALLAVLLLTTNMPNRQSFIMPAILFAMIGFYVFIICRNLLKRQFARFEVYVGMFAPIVVLFFMTELEVREDVQPFLFGLWIFALVMPLFTARYHFRLALYHWMMRGRVGEKTRQFYHEWFGTPPGQRRKAQGDNNVLTMESFQQWIDSMSPYSAKVPDNARSIRYALHYASADQTIAEQLGATMSHFHHVQVEDGQDAEQNFMIVSNHSPKSLMARAQETTRPFTLVLASSADIEEKALLDYQIVDYRQRSQSQLNAIAAYFADPQAGRHAYGLNHLPQPFDWLVLPPIVSGSAVVMRMAGAFFVSLMIAVWLTVILNRQPSSGFIPETDILSLALYTLLGIGGAGFIDLSDALIERRIPAGKFNLIGGFLLTITVVFGGLLLAREQEISQAISDVFQSLSQNPQILTMLLIPVASIIPAAWRIGIWLPVTVDSTIPQGERLMVADVPIIQTGVRDTIIMTFLLAVILLS